MDHLLPSRCSGQCTSTSQIVKPGAYTGLSPLPFASRRRAPQPLWLHIGTVRAERGYPQVSCAAKHNAKQGGAGASSTATEAKGKAGGGSAAAKNGDGAKKKARVYRRKAQPRRGRPVVKEVNPIAAGDDPARSKDASFQLDRINPVSIGRKSRQMFNEVWQQFTKLTSPISSAGDADVALGRLAGDSGEFETPQAAVTRVLVTGATGRVGRILVRKLLLRGYPLTVLVREKTSGATDFPKTVRVVEGDVGEYGACRAAVAGVQKIVYCAQARTDVTADLERVCADGIGQIAKAFQDEMTATSSGRASTSKKVIADREEFREFWRLEHLGPEGSNLLDGGADAEAENNGARSRRWRPLVNDSAKARMGKRKNLFFAGTLYSRDAYAQVGTDLTRPGGQNLANTIGLVVRVKGDGQTYTLVLTTDDGRAYSARFSTLKDRFMNVRLPYNSFRSQDDVTAGELDPGRVRHMAVKYEYSTRPARGATRQEDSVLLDRSNAGFKLEVDRIGALPVGDETDFVLVSCAGVAVEGEDADTRRKILAAKRRGEALLRQCGLGYTIVRPGPLVEEPGGYKALVFDQGNRIRESISRADAADVCLKALHDPLARNKTFEVSHEYTPAAGLEMYELVAHLPDKANSYLGPALATLEKNT